MTSIHMTSIQPIPPLTSAGGPAPAPLDAPSAGDENGSFAAALSGALDRVAFALDRADGLAAGVSAGRASIADASIARAKADVLLEIAAVAASRVSAAVTTLLQTTV